mmetsp:Transcript_11341/g.20976  ORF Transcript_11341/g.20976 Transcript_11341/m.20976 type:complete len:184 (+) Transcript_11341:773-1324(+)
MFSEQEAQMLYDGNLSKILEKIRQDRRGLHRVMMDSTGLILSISPCRLGPPQSNTFTLYIPGNSQNPRFGATTALRGAQVQIAQCLEKDINKVLRSSELAYALQRTSSPLLTKTVKVKVDELVERFGLLPEPALKHQDARELEGRLEDERKAEEKTRVWNSDIPDFEQLLRREMEREKPKIKF